MSGTRGQGPQVRDPRSGPAGRGPQVRDTRSGSRPADVAWGDGIQIPTAQWKPVSHKSFKARADEFMKNWRKNYYQQQGMTRDHQNNTTVSPKNIYEIDFDGRETPPKYDFSHAKVTYGIIAPGLEYDQFQDHSYAGDEGTTTLYHATRDAYVAAICRDGLKSSDRSHEVVGLWTRDDEDPEAAFAWGRTVLDATSSTYHI